MKRNLLSKAEKENRASCQVLVTGSGPVGVRFVNSLLQRRQNVQITLFGGEPWQPYDRVRLSSFLAGETSEASLLENQQLPQNDGRLKTWFNLPVERIDRSHKRVIDAQGNSHDYDYLVLATGSSPHIPATLGVSRLAGVFTFRNLSDAHSLKARSMRSRRTVVIGGGLLGLEAARAMQAGNTEVVIVEHSAHLMYNQLDKSAAALLQAHVKSLGMDVRVNDSVQQILGTAQVDGVVLRDGGLLDCDTVVIATGIVPNIQLARDAGLSVGRGIRVDDCLRTSDDSVFAIGECCEHKGKIYGLVAPGYEQAEVLAAYLAGDKVQYTGSLAATRLKVTGLPVIGIGDDAQACDSDPCHLVYRNNDGVYRRLLLHGKRLRGVIAIGEWADVPRLQDVLLRRQYLWPWQFSRFRREGSLWAEDGNEVDTWPADAVVCQCVGVKQGALAQICAAGACSPEDLSKATGAGTVCGSCRPLLAGLLGTALEAVVAYRSLALFSVLSVLIVLLAWFLPAVPYPSSVQAEWPWDELWRNNNWKQISGYSLLGMSVLISLISLRKRVGRLRQWGDFNYWRLAHVIIGVLAFAALLAHTGFRFGDNLNRWLMLDYTALLLLGSAGGVFIAWQHRISAASGKRLRARLVHWHILLLWPLPALLGFHIFKTYYY